MVLNLKNVPYQTVWLEYPQVAPTLKALGIPPNKEGMAYTIPAVRLPGNTCLQDSRVIASELESRYPIPSLHLDSPVLKQVEGLIPQIMNATAGLVHPKVPHNLLNPSSAEYFQRTRSERFGMPLAQLEREKGGEQGWTAVEPFLKDLGQLLRDHGGPFFMGKTISYADLVVLGLLQFHKALDIQNYERIVQLEPSLGKLYEAGHEVLAKDSD